MEDLYEGEMPKARFDLLLTALDTLAVNNPIFGTKVDVLSERFQADYAKGARKSIYVNCWHLSDFESGAIWKIYGGSAIATQSTLVRFQECFEAEPSVDIWIGSMRYVDFDAPAAAFTEHLGSGLYKRQMYDFEKEIRAVVYRPQNENAPESAGIKVAVDLKRLIESVYVGPGQPNWFVELVKEILVRCDLPSIPVQRSGMDGRPMYIS